MIINREDEAASTAAVAIIACGACSPLGEGANAVTAALRVGDAATPTRVVHDEELAAAGLARPFVARAPIAGPIPLSREARRGTGTHRDRATILLEHALTECAAELDAALPSWRSLRVGVAIGTSSGGMRSFEALFAPQHGAQQGEDDQPSAHAATYIGPMLDALPCVRVASFEPVALVLGACASSTIAIGLARTWLLEDRCDVALCGGFDAVSIFVAAGFESLRATCGKNGPQPFRAGRDGLALGEGAAMVALVREHDAHGSRARIRGWVNGFGATCDATHLTSPDPEGGGLARAADMALADAGRPSIAIVSAHGTATVQNDASEARAIVRTFHGSLPPPIFSFKGAIGHTLGAAGVLEMLSAIDAIERGLAPATAGAGAVEQDLQILDRAEAIATADGKSPSRTTALKLSSAFGGANAALVIQANPTQPTTGAPSPKLQVSDSPRDDLAIHLTRAVASVLSETEPERLAKMTGYAADRIARADNLVRLAIAAVAKLASELGFGCLRGSGIVVGHGLATIETNARFLSRITSAGSARRAEPRRFPYTTPNAAAGECAVAFGLTGPAFAVGGGPHGGIEALLVASNLVRAGVVDRMIVVAVDDAAEASERIAPGTKSGVVAFVVFAEDKNRKSASNVLPAAVARLEECTVRFDMHDEGEVNAGANANAKDKMTILPPMHAHAPLLALVGDGRPAEVEAAWHHAHGTRGGGFAKARFFWL